MLGRTTAKGFTLGSDHAGNLMLGVSLTVRAGDYELVLAVMAPSSEQRTSPLYVTVDPFATPSNAAGPPVVLLDGFQPPSLTSSCPMTTDSTGTFGNLQTYLEHQGLSVFFFENCTECANCPIEELGSILSNFLSSLAVPEVDVIAHSMGGLIVRSYLSGKQTAPGTFVPPTNTYIRKAVFIATPHFGSYQADSPAASSFFALGNQLNEMKSGSQFLWDLANWNQWSDDLRGVDAIAIIGNLGSYGTASNASDGVVALTSASLYFATPNARTRILNYCHVTLNDFEGSLAGCTGPGIADSIDSTSHPTYEIINSFLQDTNVWLTTGNPPSADQYLSRYVGVIAAAKDANDTYMNDLTSVTINGTELIPGPDTSVAVYYDDWLLAGSDTISVTSSSEGSFSGTYDWTGGGYGAALLKVPPVFHGAQSTINTGHPGITIAQGADVTISGSEFDTATAVSVAGLPVSFSVLSNGVTASLPPTLNGLLPVQVITATGQASANLLVLPALPSASDEVVTGLVNAASELSGAIAPGELITIFGTGLGPENGGSFSVDPNTDSVASTLLGTQVFIGDLPAPVTYTSANQVNAIVPYEVAGQSQVTARVIYQGVVSNESSLQVASAAPGLFTLNGSGTGQAVAANQDWTLNGVSNPAPSSSYLTIYFTGGGETSPVGVTGSVVGSQLQMLTQNVAVTVGGQPANVTFAGAAPTFVDGLNQLNIQLSGSTPAGVQPVIITVGNVSSPSTATIAVQAPPPLTLLHDVTSNIDGLMNGVCSTPPQVSSFAVTSPQVWVYFDVIGAQVGDTIQTNFILPDGTSYASLDLTIPSVGPSGYACVSSYIDINNYPAASDPGTWTVQTFWDQATKPLFTLSFTLSASSTATSPSLASPSAHPLGASTSGRRK